MPNKSHPLFDIRRLPMDIARCVCAVFIPLLRVKRITPEGTPYKQKLRGGAVVAANHTSFLDPFIVGVTFWYRRLFMLVAEVVMGGKLRSALLRGVGGIKIERGSTDIEAIKKTIGILKEGYLLEVFPQGGIQKEDNVSEIKSGAVLMALQAGVPIVPLYIAPRDRWYHRRRVVVGKTVEPKELCPKKMPTAADIQRITETLAAELDRCKRAANGQQENIAVQEEPYEYV